jgi:hypothetical protein
MPYLAVASIPASAVTFMAVPGHEQAKDAVVIAQGYGMTASTAFADGRGPGGLADEERQFAACPATRGWNLKSEQVLDVVMRRHVFASDRPFDQVPAGIFGGISQPDIAQLFSKLEASGTYQQFSSLVEQAQGSAGLMRFWQLGLDNALTLDPEAPDWTGRRLVRLIAGNPVTMGQMTRHVADAGSYAPVTILIEETPDGGTRVAYDSVVSALAPYDNAAASTVAKQLDAEVLGLLREATGVPAR